MSRGFYGISPRGFPGKTRRSERVSGPDLYAPSSPQFTERNRKTTSTLANGLTVETIGHVPGTPAPTAAPRYVHPGPERNPEPVMHPNAQRAGVSHDWRRDFGMLKSD